MDAIVMCGGRGTRLAADAEKPLFEVGGEPMVDRVVDALAASRIDRIDAAVSPHAPRTRAHLEAIDGVSVVETPGDGYVTDLGVALDSVGTPALTVAADLPLLAGGPVDRVLDAAAEGAGSLTVAVPAELKRRLGASVDGEAVEGHVPAGCNVVGDAGESTYTSYDARFAVNVNRQSDAELAEALLCE